MDEYSRIIIEEYCMNHPKTKKADFLWEMVHMSYDGMDKIHKMRK